MNTYTALSVTKPMLCVGGIGIDIVESCPMLPAEGDELISQEARWERGGHAGNVSFVLRMLGAQVEFLGMLSRSSLLSEFLLEMQHNSIDMSHCPHTDKTPAFTTVTNGRKDGLRSVLVCRRKFPFVGWDDFRKLDLDGYSWVHFEARNKRDIIPMIRSVLDFNNGRAERIKISLKVDCCYEENRDLFDMCDYLIFSRQLALDLGWRNVQETCETIDRHLPLPRSIQTRRPNIICSWGPLGAGCLDADGHYFEVPAEITKRPIDTYGVGECFTAGVIYALCLREMPLAAAVTFGNRVAVWKTLAKGYAHIANMDVYPRTVINEMEPSSVNYSEDEDAQYTICKRYFDRQIQPSDGKLATKLLQPFEPPRPAPPPSDVDPSLFEFDEVHVSLLDSNRKRKSRQSTSRRSSMAVRRRKRSA